MGMTRSNAVEDPATVPGLAGLLAAASRQLEALGSPGNTHATQLRSLGERLDAGRFHLAVLGQFKRGKSTFINALLESPLLPSSVVPLTALPTFIRWGDRAEARVCYQDGRAPEIGPSGPEEPLEVFLSRYVSEVGNPCNHKGVSQVEVRFPSPLLREGLVIIDTPGIGSTWKHNTEATLQFLPQCDAALFLVAPDPPMTEVEVAFLAKVRAKVHRILFVLNKVDYLDGAEREVIRPFLRQVLEQNLGFPEGTPIYEASARGGLQAALAGDRPGWQASGMAQIRSGLETFIRQEQNQVLEASVGTKGCFVLDAALLSIQLTLKALTLPIQDLETRLAQFEARIEDIQHERLLAGDLLAGDRKRAHAHLEELTEGLRRQARQYLMDLVKQELDRQVDPTETTIQERIAAVLPDFFESALETLSGQFAARTEQFLAAHQKRADQLLEQLRSTAAVLFDLPYRAPEGVGAFELKRTPYWVSRQWTDALSPIRPDWIDRLRPAKARRRRILARIREQVELLVVRNAENLRWSLYQGLDESLYRFSASLDEQLAASIQATREGMALGLEKRKETSAAITEEVTRLEALATRLSAMREQLAGSARPS